MLELKKGVDILSAIGGVKSNEEATALFKEKMDETSFSKIQKIENSGLTWSLAHGTTINPNLT